MVVTRQRPVTVCLRWRTQQQLSNPQTVAPTARRQQQQQHQQKQQLECLLSASKLRVASQPFSLLLQGRGSLLSSAQMTSTHGQTQAQASAQGTQPPQAYCQAPSRSSSSSRN